MNYTKYIVHVEDDGWYLPTEVTEEIEYRVTMAKQQALRSVFVERGLHRGGWLTEEVARSYEAKSWVWRVLEDEQYTGMVRTLGEELQREYGVTQVEAVNILAGVHIRDYVAKYDRIRNLIPLDVDEQQIRREVLGEFGIRAV